MLKRLALFIHLIILLLVAFNVRHGEGLALGPLLADLPLEPIVLGLQTDHLFFALDEFLLDLQAPLPLIQDLRDVGGGGIVL